MNRRNQIRITYPQELPIVTHREDILKLLKDNQVVVIAGETGSGKTTQIPKMCLEAGLTEHGRIACTQPRRVAALSISRRISEELGVEWGREVGVKIRFTDKTSRGTQIKIMTDGMLLTEIQGDSDLREYSVIIIDEAHERSLNIDFLLGYLKGLLKRRKELKVIITSATIDTEAFSKAFDNAPILEVSGRLYPVETIYAPIDEILEDTGDVTYVDAIVRAIEQIIESNRPGDMLVFLPGEKDIREVRDLLEKRDLKRLEILPLFGRLTAQEQDRIFKSSQFRKIILSTNIAETSITVPGIRFVIDSGLVRISRYSTHTHTRRLPIEKIAQSSANQRLGRAGRLSEGICVRLYSERDFLSRPEYATPEILRSNLADVILRMIAFRIGDIRTFPFIEPPSERAIRSGFELLVQLGALDKEHRLTPLGRKLAHLPVDPTVGRMLLEGHKEGCLNEILIIASGLSIQDPRERPMDLAKEADEMHRRFLHEDSDFMSLLNIWNAYHDEMEQLSQNQLRKFCKSHFLSYQRMREWRDIHAQIERTLRELREFHRNAGPAEYDQIHRALLSGLLSGVAQLEESNHYKAVRNRKVMIFPGSGLFRKQAFKRKGKGKAVKPDPAEKKKNGPKWILSAEFMETTRLYARTVARIEPAWILKVGAHVVNSKYTDPVYDEKGERVMVRERVLLYGLEIAAKRTACLKINPTAATEIFIREALVEGRMRTSPPFHESNQELLESLRERQTRLRVGSSWSLEERLYNFYDKRIQNVGSYGDLRAFIRDNHGGEAAFLFADEEDLLRDDSDPSQLEAFPDSVEVEGFRLDLKYAYKPGDEDDGATLRIPVEQFESVNADAIDWVVPGYIRQRIEHLIRGLPKAIRKELFPVADLAQELALLVAPGKGTLADQLQKLIWDRRKIHIRSQDWALESIPAHLQTRVEVLDKNEETVATGRDWTEVSKKYAEAVRTQFEKGEGHEQLSVWKKGCLKYELAKVLPSSLPEMPLELLLGDVAGLPVKAWPGLRISAAMVQVRLYQDLDTARKTTAVAYPELCAQALGRNLGWMQRDLTKELKRVALGFSFLLDLETLSNESFMLIRRYLLECENPLPLSPKTLEGTIEQAKKRSIGLIPKYVDLLDSILKKRSEVLKVAGKTAAWQMELNSLVHARFLRELDMTQLNNYLRYLDALKIRIERARQNPAKDLEKAQPLIAFIRRFQGLKTSPVEKRKLRWQLEEFKVQVFAQELGTRVKVSSKLISNTFERLENQSGRKT